MENKNGKKKLGLKKIKVTHLNKKSLNKIHGGNTIYSIGQGCKNKSKNWNCGNSIDPIGDHSN
ncbi:hypothetical protein [Aquimarina algiphila]|uniref:hypothetical protein n=1 Tax=Aquimarina algiphila TaxID=2047982 RepID=UPI002491A039|nr:hypothetical protein [Aquimarina algiphila]